MNKLPYEDYPEVLNAEQLAALLGISRAGAYQLLRRVDFSKLHIGKRKLVPKDKLIAWIDRRTGEGDFCKLLQTVRQIRQVRAVFLRFGAVLFKDSVPFLCNLTILE